MFEWVLYWHNNFNKAMVAFSQLLPDFVSGLLSGFSAVLVINRVSILAILVINRVWF